VRAATVAVSNPRKVLFPADGITKADLAAYYLRVAPTMLPHLAGRPVTMHRFPDGIGALGFLQKNVPDTFPDWVERVRVLKKTGHLDHLLCADAATLVFLADQGTITPHVWLSRADAPMHPDRLVLDLDPPGAFEEARFAARAARALFEEVGLKPFVMTTGSRGLHVVVPLDRRWVFDRVREFARDAAALLARRNPDRLTTEHRKAKRGDRVFLDAGRNAYAQTVVAPYAVRALDGAPVATPLDWEELARLQDAGRYTLRNLFRRLARKGDPWRGIHRHAQSLVLPRRRLDALLAG
jgi:bifunctional non-homologous end joining protein LigD